MCFQYLYCDTDVHRLVLHLDPEAARKRQEAARAAGDRFDGLVAHRWHGLVMVSRMMPGPAGRRWLAEAGSVLWEITAAQRATAVRSYLLSGPRLAAVMWAYAGLRRVRPGPRHPR